MRLFSFRIGRSAVRAVFRSATPSFRHLDPGLLRDGEMELVPPAKVWVDAVLAACGHPLTRSQSPALRDTTRQQLMDFLTQCPGGRQMPDPSQGLAAGYHFWMRCHDTPDLPIAGGVGLRIGDTTDLDLYYGHFGYHVYPTHQGRRFSERAVRLLLPLARRHGHRIIWITCNPDNQPSRKTCEHLGARYVDTVPVPADHALFSRGEHEKCRYRLEM
jgi:tagatose 1,6-diphosphate aldolase